MAILANHGKLRKRFGQITETDGNSLGKSRKSTETALQALVTKEPPSRCGAKMHSKNRKRSTTTLSLSPFHLLPYISLSSYLSLLFLSRPPSSLPHMLDHSGSFGWSTGEVPSTSTCPSTGKSTEKAKPPHQHSTATATATATATSTSTSQSRRGV